MSRVGRVNCHYGTLCCPMKSTLHVITGRLCLGTQGAGRGQDLKCFPAARIDPSPPQAAGGDRGFAASGARRNSAEHLSASGVQGSGGDRKWRRRGAVRSHAARHGGDRARRLPAPLRAHGDERDRACGGRADLHRAGHRRGGRRRSDVRLRNRLPAQCCHASGAPAAARTDGGRDRGHARTPAAPTPHRKVGHRRRCRRRYHSASRSRVHTALHRCSGDRVRHSPRPRRKEESRMGCPTRRTLGVAAPGDAGAG